MRPRCLHCNRGKAIKGTSYCYRHQGESEKSEQFWRGVMRTLVDAYERETGEIQMPNSHGWTGWLDRRVFPQGQRPSK